MVVYINILKQLNVYYSLKHKCFTNIKDIFFRIFLTCSIKFLQYELNSTDQTLLKVLHNHQFIHNMDLTCKEKNSRINLMFNNIYIYNVNTNSFLIAYLISERLFFIIHLWLKE